MSVTPLAFSGKSVDRRIFREQSKRAADEFGSRFGLGEAVFLGRDLFGFRLDPNTALQAYPAAQVFGGFLPEEEELVESKLETGSLHQRRRKQVKKPRPQRSRGIEGGKLVRMSAFESEAVPTQESKMKIQEGRFILLGSAFDAVRVALNEDSSVKESRRAQMRSGKYFVQGVSPDEKIVTLSVRESHGGVVYNVTTESLNLAMAARDSKDAVVKLQQDVVERFKKSVSRLSFDELQKLKKESRINEEDGTTEDPMADDSSTAGDPLPPPSGLDLGPPGGDNQLVPISKKDFETKEKEGRAAYKDGVPNVILVDKDTGMTALVGVEVMPNDAEEVSGPSVPTSGEKKSDEGGEKPKEDEKKESKLNEMAMSKKHYVAIAQILKKYLGPIGADVMQNLVRDLSAVFADDNPAFDTGRFGSAALGESKKAPKREAVVLG